MTTSVSTLVFVILSFSCALALLQPGGTPKGSNSDVTQLSSADQAERRRALDDLTKRYFDERRQLAIALETAAKEYTDDDFYMSPLHTAILAVERCRVSEAESSLFSIIDYELDGRSLPDGRDIPGSFFYPAAAALVGLRVDTTNVVNAMVVTAKTDRQLQLLTWVLFRRAGSADEAKRILRASGSDRNKNLHKAVELLDRAPDLLPPRRKG